MIAFLKTNVYSVLNTCVLVFIGIYRAVGSLWLSGACRFEPSCSVYAQEAVERYGFWVGGRLAAARLWRCRPAGPFGYDPVPDHCGKSLREQHEVSHWEQHEVSCLKPSKKECL